MNEQRAMPILNEQQRKVQTQVSTNKEDIAALRNELAQLQHVVNTELVLIRELSKANPQVSSLGHMDRDIQALQVTLHAPPTDTQLGLGNGGASKVMVTDGAMDPTWVKSVDERIAEQGKLLAKLDKVYKDMHANLPLLSCRTSRIALRAVELSAEDRKLALEALNMKENRIREDIDKTTDRSSSINYSQMASITEIVSPYANTREGQDVNPTAHAAITNHLNAGGAYGYSGYSNPNMSAAGPPQGSRSGQPPALRQSSTLSGYAMTAPKGTNLT